MTSVASSDETPQIFLMKSGDTPWDGVALVEDTSASKNDSKSSKVVVNRGHFESPVETDPSAEAILP